MTGKEAKVHRGVQAAIRSDPLLRGQEIAIAVRAGVVALYGCLDNFQDVEDAVKAAKLVRGVRAVANELRVRRSRPAGQTDAELAREVLHRLRWYVFIPDSQVMVTLDNGWVTLEGRVEQAREVEQAEDTVQRLPGVRGVSNLIRVVEERPPHNQDPWKEDEHPDPHPLEVGPTVRGYGP